MKLEIDIHKLFDHTGRNLGLEKDDISSIMDRQSDKLNSFWKRWEQKDSFSPLSGDNGGLLGIS